MNLFPSFRGKWGYINLDREADLFLRNQGVSVLEMKKSPFLEPAQCARALKRLHQKMYIDASYGGWLEDRTTLWRGSYMAATGSYIHIGVDFNVPAGTEVALPFSGTLVWRDNDTPDEHGWGPRLMFETLDRKHVVIFAHLGNVSKKPLGSHCAKGSIVAEVALKDNGGWFPHLHVQVMTREAFERFKKRGFKNLDGYAPRRALRRVFRDFCDPLPFVIQF